MLSTYVMIYKAFNHGSVRVTIIMAPVLILKDEYFFYWIRVSLFILAKASKKYEVGGIFQMGGITGSLSRGHLGGMVGIPLSDHTLWYC